ncbi:alpha/beta hydrolase [Weissella paramesenteroides]|uniref:alpha/beta hydrolase n=1 Tax=Weissella paramesenteroides TaxID=1249 RepID=UPI002E7C1E46|nr:alpha/beta hydrolase-fold protein [Weissella paramesenteroides]WPQ68726.1 alpha/beta hydrolase-fold protein [Weissella paramesenteroides]
MAINRLSFYSEELEMKTGINVILPEHPSGEGKTLLLLHGLGDDENSWLDRTRLAEYAENTDLTIIMPRVDRSYYANRNGDSKYFEYISQEILQRCQQWFHLSSMKEKTFIAGISMGGFGALKTGLVYPNQFQTIFAMSSMTDIVRKWHESPNRDAWYRGLFGSPDQVMQSNNDIAYLVGQQEKQTPFIWQLCGYDDPYYDMNVTLSAQIEQKGLRHEFVEVEGGHEWSVWDKAIQQIITIIVKNN